MEVAQLGLFNPVFSTLFISSATKAIIALEIYNPASNDIQCEITNGLKGKQALRISKQHVYEKQYLRMIKIWFR